MHISGGGEGVLVWFPEAGVQPGMWAGERVRRHKTDSKWSHIKGSELHCPGVFEQEHSTVL